MLTSSRRNEQENSPDLRSRRGTVNWESGGLGNFPAISNMCLLPMARKIRRHHHISHISLSISGPLSRLFRCLMEVSLSCRAESLMRLESSSLHQ